MVAPVDKHAQSVVATAEPSDTSCMHTAAEVVVTPRAAVLELAGVHRAEHGVQTDGIDQNSAGHAPVLHATAVDGLVRLRASHCKASFSITPRDDTHDAVRYCMPPTPQD